MRLLQPNHQRRSAFTIIELLVVIVIIGIMMALLTSAVSRIFIYVDEVRTVSEINQLSQSCEAFKTQYTQYPPGRIRLFEKGSGAYPTLSTSSPDPLEQYSYQYLQKVFTGIDLSVDHDWNGDGTIAASGAYVDLEGEESLVYFLRGPTGNGWNSFKATPAAVSTGSRVGPFYEFDPTRIFPATTIGLAATHSAYPVYRDRYGTPYAYFLARYGNQNNYPCGLFSVSNDCPTLCGTGFVPYWQTLNSATTTYTFHRPDKFQILSAGRDAVNGVYAALYVAAGASPPPSPFGYGGMYDSAQNTPTVGADRDNLSNFTEGPLAPK